MAPDGIPASSGVVVLGGDVVVGRALELLLRSVDRNVRFLTMSSLDEPKTFDGIGLVLLCPGLSAERRETLLALVGGTPAKVEIPVLELVENSEGARAGSKYLLPWPCRAEDLKQRINSILVAGFEPARDNH